MRLCDYEADPSQAVLLIADPRVEAADEHQAGVTGDD